MHAIILAAGYGTRLRHVIGNKPKALVKIGEKTILDYLVKNIENTDIKNTTIVTNNKFYQQFMDWKEQYRGSLKINIVNNNTNTNEERLGGIKDLHLGITSSNIEEDILILSSDNILNFSLNEFIKYFKTHNQITNGSVIIPNKEEIKKMGVIQIDELKRIISFEEKPENPRSNLGSIGCYIFPKNKLNLIKEYLDKNHNPEGPGFLIQHLHNKYPIHCFITNTSWFDIGTAETLKQAQEAFKDEI